MFFHIQRVLNKAIARSSVAGWPEREDQRHDRREEQHPQAVDKAVTVCLRDPEGQEQQQDDIEDRNEKQQTLPA